MYWELRKAGAMKFVTSNFFLSDFSLIMFSFLQNVEFLMGLPNWTMAQPLGFTFLDGSCVVNKWLLMINCCQSFLSKTNCNFGSRNNKTKNLGVLVLVANWNLSEFIRFCCLVLGTPNLGELNYFTDLLVWIKRQFWNKFASVAVSNRRL